MHAVHRMAWGTTLGTLCFGDAHGFQDRAYATQELFCEFEVGGRRFGIVGHDWRRESRAQWFERLRRIVRREPGEQPAPPPDEPTVLSRDEFDRCVRRALKALGKQGAPEDNPLERSHLVRNTSLPGAATLDGRIRAMVDRLEGGAGTRMHGAVLRGTYLGEASKGLAVADALGLPYGSYRRALRQGINAACDVLWDWELSNP